MIAKVDSAPTPIDFEPPLPESLTLSDSLQENVRQVVYDLLGSYHGGWEINEGSYGHFEWDVTADLMTHHHSTRFVDTAFLIVRATSSRDMCNAKNKSSV